MLASPDNRCPGDAEAAAAIAAMREVYADYVPSPGDVVICEPPYIGGTCTGIVRQTNGTSCTVEVRGESLIYYPHELRWTGRRVEG